MATFALRVAELLEAATVSPARAAEKMAIVATEARRICEGSPRSSPLGLFYVV